MNAKFVKTRKFVSDNRTYLAFTAGVWTTAGIVILFNKDKTLLELTQAHAQMLKEGGAVVYELKDQTLHLMNIPAVEAALAVAQ